MAQAAASTAGNARNGPVVAGSGCRPTLGAGYGGSKARLAAATSSRLKPSSKADAARACCQSSGTSIGVPGTNSMSEPSCRCAAIIARGCRPQPMSPTPKPLDVVAPVNHVYLQQRGCIGREGRHGADRHRIGFAASTLVNLVCL